MTRLLLDTSVIVHALRNDKKFEQIKRVLPEVLGNESFICIVSVGEVLSLSVRPRWGDAKIRRLELLLGELAVVGLQSKRVLDVYAKIDVGTMAVGRRMGKNDLWIAAAAAATRATLVTTDKDFEPAVESQLVTAVVIP